MSSGRVTAALTVLGQPSLDEPDAIILCAWYVQKGISAAYPDTAQFDDNYFSRRARHFPTSLEAYGYAPIDNFNLFDSTVMHEVSFPHLSLSML